MAALVLDGSGLTIEMVVEVARAGRTVAIAPAVWPRLEAARAVVERHLDANLPIYGLNTGLGGNLRHRLAPDEIAAFQAQLIRGRAVALGPSLPAEHVRAGLLARANGMARGVSGVSPAVLAALVELLNRHVTPVVPAYGSIGAADLAPMAHIGLVFLGLGEAELGGERLPGAEALRRAGLTPLEFAAKDAIGLINANALTVGQAVLVLDDARRLTLAATAAAALSCEGYGSNLATFDARTAALRPAPHQESAAALYRALLAGSSLEPPGAARAIQDALSFRCLPQITGAALAALDHAVAITETELNAAADNPAVLADDGQILSTGNFHLAALALTFDGLALALAQFAHACMAHLTKLVSAAHSDLPRYLSPVGGASAGLVPMLKPAGAVLAGIRQKAAPACLDALAISDFVEDHATHAPLAVRKLEEQLHQMARLVAIEALIAAQAVDLRAPPQLGAGTRLLHTFVRETVPALDTDRELGARRKRSPAASSARTSSGDCAASISARPGGFGLPPPRVSLVPGPRPRRPAQRTTPLPEWRRMLNWP